MAFTVAAAATIAIVIAVGILPSSTDQDRLYDRYYMPIEASDNIQRGSQNEKYSPIAEGIGHYMGGDYEQCIVQFGTLASDLSFHQDVQLFSGLSHMGLGQYEQAQNLLETIVDGNSRWQAEALWYLSLCYLKTSEFDKATALLKQLENYDGMYKSDAQTFRKKLRRFI